MPTHFSLPDHQFPLIGGTQDIFFPRFVLRDVPTIVAGDGVYLVDDAGRRLLDVCSMSAPVRSWRTSARGTSGCSGP